jgi:hypothetical protein
MKAEIILEKQRLENEVQIAKQSIEIEALNRKNIIYFK